MSAPTSRTGCLRRVATAVIATGTSLALLVGCAANEGPTPTWPSVSLDDMGSDLPVGAELVDPADLDTQTEVESISEEPFGTLRPDDSSVKERVPAILKRGRLVVGVGQYLNRLGFRDPLTGELGGFEVDLAREIARDIFGDPNKVEFRYVESRRREAALHNGDVDVVLRTWTMSRDRQSQTEFSLPYLSINSQLLVMRDSGITNFDSLRDRTVCAARDSAPARKISRYELGGLLLTRTWTDCLMAMQRNQADAIYSDDAILSGLQAQDPYMELVGGGEMPNYYAVGMATPESTKGSRGLVEQVNSTILRVRSDGTWDDLYEEWMQEYLGPARALPVYYRSESEDRQLSQERKRWEKEHPASSGSKILGTLPKEAFDD
ncbi:ABC transporter glutamine-binding protein GlnH precursor [Corynebacterium urogenitale]|uniref:ABC transporter glutamine-binding protein GlnH n=1 Tax=Corynebacterium urogenitale TaxID=2487892 RepID=A0A5J6Z3U5_9CORY|nr:glutamate ABC transporter substrate-binding protein [Corynebacterium urogenitale]QFQ01716.1 ABC transporter glutamine-binding protein GlnH precursor [Corynebacterium urogenitale]